MDQPTCQPALTYMQMKILASQAIKANKIFVIYGNCDSVRIALEKRGWVEKLSPNRIHISKTSNTSDSDESDLSLLGSDKIFLSNLTVNAKPNFIWNARYDIKLHYYHKIMYNRIQIARLWASKLGLCAALKNNQWHYIEDVAEVNCPRTYACVDGDDLEDFKSDYKITACTSLLKWVLSMNDNQCLLFSETGTVATNVLVFAINRCKEYLFSKQHKDIDKHFLDATNAEWNAFLKNYYILMARKDTFKPDKDNKLSLFLEYARFLLKGIYKFRPQINCEGCHNIWIIKPTHWSRGRGIRMASKLRVLTELLSKGKYICQKYIEEPLLIHGTKFDIRQYFLVTSTVPLKIWMYKNCYLKFSSQKYNVKNYHESIHLTNNAVQKKYINCKFRHPELPHHNMWSLDTFKGYLKSTENAKVWDNIIYPGMKKCIVGIMMSCQESITDCKNNFEVYGCDFILDKNYKPWLIEINASPDYSPTTPVTSQLCPAVLTDTIKVVIDHAANARALTGEFECIYDRISMRSCDTEAHLDLTIQGRALPRDYFFRGNIEHANAYSNASFKKDQDVTTMLHNLKMIYGSDIMIEPLYSSNEFRFCSSEVDYVSSGSDEDLDKIATVIAAQLDSLINRIPIASQLPDTQSEISKYVGRVLSEEIDVRNVIEILEHNARCCGVSIDGNSVTRLDQSKKRSSDTSKENVSQIDSIIKLEPNINKSTSRPEEQQCYDEFLEIAEKIFSFLISKEQECIRDI